MNDIYQKNLAALERSQPGLAKRLASKENFVPIKLVDTPSGHPTLMIRNDKGVEDYLHSSYNPKFEARDLLQFKSYNRIPRILVFYGLGLGYHLEEFLANPNIHTAHILVIEKEPAVLAEALKRHDYSWLIGSRRLTFFAGEQEAKLRSQLIDYFLEDGRYYFGNCIEHLILENCVTLFSDYYVSISKAVKETLDNVVLGIGNSYDDAYIGIENVIDNTRAIAEAPYISALEDAFVGKPGVVIASGPSLSHSIDILRQIQDKAVLIACDSALKHLLESGIKPAMVATIERVDLVKQFFTLSHDLSDVYTLAIPVLLKDVMDVLPPKRFMAFQSNNSFNWLPYDYKQYFMGPSCATLALNTLRLAGCNPIYLFGQDLAYDPTSGTTHASGITYHLNLKLEDENKGKVRTIEGNSGQPIPTTHVWAFMKRVLEYMLSKGDQTVYNNMPEAMGAKIHGTTRLDPLQTLAHFADRPQFNARATLSGIWSPTPAEVVQEKITETKRRLKAYGEALRSTIHIVDRALKFAATGAQTQEKMLFFDQHSQKKLFLQQMESAKREMANFDPGLASIMVDLFQTRDLHLIAQFHQLSAQDEAQLDEKTALLARWLNDFKTTCTSCMNLVDKEQEL